MEKTIRLSLKTTRLIVSFGLVAFACQSTRAADGNNPLNLSTFNGWSAFELITQGDDISSISDPGYGNTAARGRYDGLGGYLSGNNLSIFINHEATNAAISRLDLDLANLRSAIASTINGGSTVFPSSIATGMGYAYSSIHDGTYHAVNNPSAVASGTVAVGVYGDANFGRFCSGTAHLASSFGSGKGFEDQIYLTGEEVGGGRFYAIDSANNVLWEAPDLGVGAWENAALVETGNYSHVALLINSDSGTAPGDYVQMYVGKKGVDVNGDGTIDFLERNGLRGGTVYYFDPDGAAPTDDLPDGQVTGVWTTTPTNALRETKLEDVHTNPNNGSQLVLNDQTDGVYIIDFA